MLRTVCGITIPGLLAVRALTKGANPFRLFTRFTAKDRWRIKGHECRSNVVLSGARQRVRLSEMLDTARELATNAHSLRVRARAHANSSIPHRQTLAKRRRAASGPNASACGAGRFAGCLAAKRSGGNDSHVQSGAQRGNSPDCAAFRAGPVECRVGQWRHVRIPASHRFRVDISYHT
jgi:hypothetical protein